MRPIRREEPAFQEYETGKKPMRILGITGGVGAGKSRLLDFLREHYGARVFQADEAGHQVMEPGTAAYEEIVSLFGREILRSDKRVDRQALGALVFFDAAKRKALNGIVHPAVKELAREAVAEAEREGNVPLFVIEAALLIEDHYEEICDELWYVYADQNVRRERLKSSRGYTQEKISAIFESQLSEEEFRRHCQVLIDNSGSFEETIRQTKGLLEKSFQTGSKLSGDGAEKDRRGEQKI